MAKWTKAQKAEAYEGLKHFLKRGETIYCVLRHVSRSGMMRCIDLYVIRKGEPRWISYQVAILTDNPVNQGAHDGVKIGGCGMDMGFALVYHLGSVLYPHGIRVRKGEWHNGQPVGSKYDGGYAFKHRWM